MLELYKDGQPIFYNMVNNAIKNNKLSHAYIFDSNGNPDVMDIVLSFVKEIICMDITDDNNIKNICKRIDDGNYVDVKVIKSDGMWIKKDQLLDLQSEFNNKAFEGNKKIYIIRSAEKMNVQTANSILKFLEEPVDDFDYG
jgi:DNA polymerase-3 subunit delta'